MQAAVVEPPVQQDLGSITEEKSATVRTDGNNNDTAVTASSASDGILPKLRKLQRQKKGYKHLLHLLHKVVETIAHAVPA